VPLAGRAPEGSLVTVLRVVAAWVLFVGVVAESADAAADRAARALRAEEAVVLDGVLDEAVWRRAESAGDFTQTEPRQGQAASEHTEVRIVFDEDNVYFGVECRDRDAAGIVARSLRVDFPPAEEDYFAILLDPFASFQDAFLFIINPNGAKRDEQITSGGLASNVNWDGAWDVRTQRNPAGWTAEIRIPFNTLRYRKGDSRSWSINFGRQIRRHNEIAHWAPIPRQFNIKHVSLAGRLEGLDTAQIDPGRNLLVTPYVVVNQVDRAAREGLDKDIGADVKFGLTPGLTLDLTYNTDFSHVEVDAQQVNLDRFRLSFPEKRDFFLENAGVFDIGSVGSIVGRTLPETPVIFYSRNIGLSLDGRPVPITGGGRLTGRIGRSSVGLMSIRTGEGADQAPETATVLRVKSDLAARSYMGAFFLNRSGSDRPTNSLFGVDGLYRPRTDLTFSGYVAKSQVPGVHGDDWILRLEGLYESRQMVFNITHANMQKNYRNDLGFVLRPAVAANRIEWRPILRPWPQSALREIRGIVNLRYITDPNSRLMAREFGYGVDFSFQRGTFLRLRERTFFERLDDRFEIRRTIFIPAGDYNYFERGIEFNTDRSRAFSGSMKWYTGDFWSGDKTSWEVIGQYRPGGHISTEVSLSRDRVDLATGRFNVLLSGLRVQYSFNTRTFVDLFTQYNNETHRLTSNLRLNWIHRPLSDLYVVYTEERPTLGPTQTDRVVSVKYTHLLSF
jgi:hypothetical protein